MKTSKLSFLILLSCIILSLYAEKSARDLAIEAKIEKQIGAIDPSMVQTFREANVARDSSNMELADSLYSLVLAKAPGFEPVLRRLGGVKFQLGHIQEGLALANQAVSQHRTAYNLMTLGSLYGMKSDSTDLIKAYMLLKEAQVLPDGDEPDVQLELTQIAIELNNTAKFIVEAKRLKSKFPELMQTHYYAAILAAYETNWREAKKEILKARELGLPQEEVDSFLNGQINSELRKQDAGIIMGVVVALWALGFLLLFLCGKLFSGMTLKAIENNTLETSQARPGGWLRTGYKAMINIAGFYYYISLPVVLVLVVALTGGLIFLFIAAGTIPIKLAGILIIGAGTTIYSMIRSLLVKVDTTDPGRELKREEAPELYRLTEEVAHKMHTRPIDEIRITPLNDMAVYEKGTWREKMNDKGKRILILGTSVLYNFRKSDFKAVLAHEYGHFTNRDTAGGEIAMRVKNDMMKYFIALHNAGQNTIWNVAFHFLRLYNFIFRRISHGATRLQEVLADRIAAETYGTPAFINGLTHVIKREIEFNRYANEEIQEAIKVKRPLNNLYELNSNLDAGIEEELDKALNCKTTEDDTHPSPVDRFRYISGLNSTIIREDSLVKDLFCDWNALTVEMTGTIDAKVDRY